MNNIGYIVKYQKKSPSKEEPWVIRKAGPKGNHWRFKSQSDAIWRVKQLCMSMNRQALVYNFKYEPELWIDENADTHKVDSFVELNDRSKDNK